MFSPRHHRLFCTLLLPVLPFVLSSVKNCEHPQLSVLLMTYNRVASANSVVWQLRQLLGNTRNVRLVVAQNHDKGSNYSSALSAILEAEHDGMFCKIEHVLTPMLRKEMTSSFGSKRNAQNNLLNGLRTLFGSSVVDQATTSEPTQGTRARGPRTVGYAHASNGRPSVALVLEDDVILSSDALEYFSYAGELRAHSVVQFVTNIL